MIRRLLIDIDDEELKNADKIISSARKDGYELKNILRPEPRVFDAIVTLCFEFVGINEGKGKKK